MLSVQGRSHKQEAEPPLESLRQTNVPVRELIGKRIDHFKSQNAEYRDASGRHDQQSNDEAKKKLAGIKSKGCRCSHALVAICLVTIGWHRRPRPAA